ncbi:MAG TPA: hypothetical protein VLI54_07115 [Bacillota bacterium]|nr:hypothetical protein [Bacillota bacterium]
MLNERLSQFSIDTTPPAHQAFLGELAAIRDAAFVPDGGFEDVTPQTAQLLSEPPLPASASVYAAHNNRGTAMLPELIVALTPDGDPYSLEYKQLMTINPEHAEILVDDGVRAAALLEGHSLHPALSGLAAHLEAVRSGAPWSASTESAFARAQAKEADAIRNIRRYPSLSKVFDASGLYPSLLSQKLEEGDVLDIGRHLTDAQARAAVQAIFDEQGLDLSSGRGFALVYEPFVGIKGMGATVVTTPGIEHHAANRFADDTLGRDSELRRPADASAATRNLPELGKTPPMHLEQFLRLQSGNRGHRKIYLSSDHTPDQVEAVRLASRPSTDGYAPGGRAIVTVMPAPGKILPIAIGNFIEGGIFLADQ